MPPETPSQRAREAVRRLLDGRYSSSNPLRGLEDEITAALAAYAEAAAGKAVKAERERCIQILRARARTWAGHKSATAGHYADEATAGALALRAPGETGG